MILHSHHGCAGRSTAVWLALQLHLVIKFKRQSGHKNGVRGVAKFKHCRLAQSSVAAARCGDPHGNVRWRRARKKSRQLFGATRLDRNPPLFAGAGHMPSQTKTPENLASTVYTQTVRSDAKSPWKQCTLHAKNGAKDFSVKSQNRCRLAGGRHFLATQMSQAETVSSQRQPAGARVET